MLVKVALRSFMRYKLRTVLTILGLAIAVVGITGFSITSASLRTSIARSMGLGTAPDAIIHVRDAQWNDSFVEGVERYEVIYRMLTRTEIGGRTERVVISGVDQDAIGAGSALNQIVLKEGRLPRSGEVMIEQSAAEALGLTLGTQLGFSLPNVQGKSVRVNVTISGTAIALDEMGYQFSSAVSIWMGLEEIQSLLGAELFSELRMMGTEDEIRAVAQRMTDQGVFVNQVIMEDEDGRTELLDILGVVSAVVAGTGLLVGGVLAATTIQNIVSSDRKNIAMMKIIGGRNGILLRLYLLEVVGIGVIGAVAGLFLSIVGGRALLELVADPFNLPVVVFVVPPGSIVTGLFVPVATAVLVSLPILSSVMKVPPMAYFGAGEDRSRGFRIQRWTFAAFSWGNLRRSRRRLITLTLMFSLSVSLVVSITSLGDSYTKKIDDFLGAFPADIMVTSSTPIQQDRMETVIEEFFTSHHQDELESYTSLWWSSVRVDVGEELYPSLLGIDPLAPEFRRYRVVEGRWFSEEDHGRPRILVTRLFVRDHFGGETPDTLVLETFSANVTAEVIGVIDDINNGGLMIYMELDVLQEFLRGEGLVNMVYINIRHDHMGTEIADQLSEYESVRSYGWSVVSVNYWREFNLRSGQFFILFVVALSSIGILVAIIGGANSYLMSILDREREIGILKLMGATPRWIFLSVLMEGVLQGLLSTAVGVSLSRFIIVPLIVHLISTNIVEMDVVFGLRHVLIGLTLTLTALVLGILFPAVRARRTSVLSALRYE